MELRSHLAHSHHYQRLCLRYLVGSVVVSGRADEEALDAISNLCRAARVEHLSDLSDELARSNDCDTVAQFIANKSLYLVYGRLFMDQIIEIVDEDSSAMEELVMKILALFEKDTNRAHIYGRFVRRLPAERQCEMLSAGGMPLSKIKWIYASGFDPLLAEVFVLARCSSKPDPKVRKHIADNFPQFRMFLPDSSTVDAAVWHSDDIPPLNADIWFYISKFMDAETVLFVLPSVCSFWRRLYSRILAHDTRIHDLYLHDLAYTQLTANYAAMYKIVPWKYCLPNEATALRYFGRCITSGALGRASLKRPVQDQAILYLKHVTRGELPLPAFRHCITPYDSFLRLLEVIRGFDFDGKLILDKPVFLTDEEYERAIRYCLFQREWALKLPASLVVDDMPRLFGILEEDGALMKRLARKEFGNFEEPSIILVMHGQTRGISEKLARLMFSQSHMFKRLLEPRFIDPSEYYNFIVEADILPELMRCCYTMGRLHQLLISLILFFKNVPKKTDRIVVSTTSRFAHLDGRFRKCIEHSIREGIFRILGTDELLPEDATLLKMIMRRLGWLG